MVNLRDDLSTVYKVYASQLNLPSVEPDKETIQGTWARQTTWSNEEEIGDI